MSEIQLYIQELTELVKADAQNPDLGTNLYPLPTLLKNVDYALSFLHQEGLPLIFDLLKNGHVTAKDLALAAFLNLICHYPVITAIVNEDHLAVDMDIFRTLITCYMQSEQFGERKIIRESTSALTFFIQTLPNGFRLFRQAVRSFPVEKDPYQCLVNNIVHSQLYSESLRLLQLIIRNSIIINSSEPIDRLTKCGLVTNLKLLKKSEDKLINLSSADKILIDELLLPLGDTCSRVGWYIEAVRRQPTKEIIEKVMNDMSSNISKHDILRIADERLEDKLEEHLIEIHENIEKEFSRMNSSLTLGSPSSTKSVSSPKNIGSPSSVSRQRSDSIPVTTTSTVSTVTESGAVPIGHLCLYEKCDYTACIFFRTLADYLKTLFTALKIGGGAPIQLEEIDQCIDLPGKPRKRSGVLLMAAFRRTTKREKNEDQISFLIDVVSESTSQTVSLRYYSALSNLSVSDVQKLAESALWKIMEGLRQTQSKLSCNAILKSITSKPQESIQLFLSYVYGKSLPASIHVCHPKDGDISVDYFFKRNQSEGNSGENDISDTHFPSEKKSTEFETKVCSSNPNVPSPPTNRSDALARINEIELQIHQAKTSISELNMAVSKLNVTVTKLEGEVIEIKSSFN